MLYYFIYNTTGRTETRCDMYTTDNFTRLRSCIFCDDDDDDNIIIYYYINVERTYLYHNIIMSHNIMLARLRDRNRTDLIILRIHR